MPMNEKLEMVLNALAAHKPDDPEQWIADIGSDYAMLYCAVSHALEIGAAHRGALSPELTRVLQNTMLTLKIQPDKLVKPPEPELPLEETLAQPEETSDVPEED